MRAFIRKLSNHRYRPYATSLFVCLAALLVIVCSGCKKETSTPMDDLLGDWHLSIQNQHMILLFHMDGRFTLDTKIVGNLSNVVTSKGIVTGVVTLDENQLTLTPDQVEIEKSNWVVGEPKAFTITEKNEDNLILTNEAGRPHTWKRTRSKPATAPAAVETGKMHVIRLDPIVVNLKKDAFYAKDRFLCMDLEILLKEGILLDPETGYWIHPRIQEAATFFLSNQTYDKVKTFDHSQKVVEKLKGLLTPYMNNNIDKLNIKALIVTSKIVVVDDFIAARTPPPPAEKSEEDTDGATKNKGAGNTAS
ncbi:MAG: hypothetical protein CSA22_02200 [Deltaproteobacteria bacterium]|nr:MAG: hypothetical protein CSA22_02200 [Deltaproteobacteria bacterium]